MTTPKSSRSGTDSAAKHRGSRRGRLRRGRRASRWAALMMWRADGRGPTRSRSRRRPKPVTVLQAAAATYRAVAQRTSGRCEPWVAGQRRPAARLGVRRHGAGAAGRDGEAGRCPGHARLPERERLDPGRRTPGARRRRAARRRIADESSADPGPPRRRLRLAERGRAEERRRARRKQAQLRGREGQACRAARSRSTTASCGRRSTARSRTRFIDPGAFVRPGAAIVTVVDRSTVRVTADAPGDRLRRRRAGTPGDGPRLATGKDLRGHHRAAARRPPTRPRAPSTSRSTSPTRARAIPVGTTGEVHIDVGDARARDRGAALRGHRARGEGQPVRRRRRRRPPADGAVSWASRGGAAVRRAGSAGRDDRGRRGASAARTTATG